MNNESITFILQYVLVMTFLICYLSYLIGKNKVIYFKYGEMLDRLVKNLEQGKKRSHANKEGC